MALIDPQDAAFLNAETREHPMHVGGLAIFTLPEDAPDDYLAQLHEQLLSQTEVRPLLRRHPTSPVSYTGRLSWTYDEEVDLRYHVRLAQLPSPGTEAQLHELAASLSSPLLDRHRPLWEYTLIGGLEGGRFATHLKLHHSLADGIAGMDLVMSCMSPDPSRETRPFWSPDPSRAKPSESDDVVEPGILSQMNPLPYVTEAAKTVRSAVGGAVKLTGLGAELVRGEKQSPPLGAPKTMLNVEIGGARTFTAGAWDFSRLRRISAAQGVTLNDVVLAQTSGALIRYLDKHETVPSSSLVAIVPVAVSMTASGSGGNAIGSVLCSLATDVADPAQRMQVIHESMATAKEASSYLGAAGFQLVGTVVMAAPVALGLVPGMTDATPALFNLMVSNVPGPRIPLYWEGAKLENIYPMSIATDGSAMNVTVLSYNGQVQFGVIGCRRSVPEIEDMLGFLEESLVELEQATPPMA
jgi:diacylglycerol O-acyltransferase